MDGYHNIIAESYTKQYACVTPQYIIEKKSQLYAGIHNNIQDTRLSKLLIV